MNLVALSLAVLAASLHAGWSLLSKRLSDYDAFAFIWLASLGSFVVYAPVTIWLTDGLSLSLSAPQTVFLAGSIVINLAYFVVTQHGYRFGDLSLVYPIARGTGPILATVGGIVFLGQVPGAVATIGLVAVAAGVAALGLHRAPRGPVRPPGGGYGGVVGYGLLSGVTIAGYTLWDQHAVGPLGISPFLLNWVDDAGRVLLLAPVVLRRREEVRRLWRDCRLLLCGAATLMPLPYLLFLFSLRLAPASVVSPVRESSVLLVVLASGALLAEGHRRFRLLASAGVVLGLALLAVGS
ncbi:EamA family transporter [Actinosynnema sp. CS-041913]|uniref:EamA family transporter n=1 Tax=Actinosynnema sp. CS-041913 TaxID=3239917 RepID=UPI003D91DEDE